MIVKGRAFACTFQSEGQKEAAVLQRQLSDEAKQLFDIGQPYLKQTMTDFVKDLGKPGSEPASVKDAFAEINKNQEKQFDQQKDALPAEIAQTVKQSGYRGARGATDEASKSALIGLEQRRRSSQRQLKQQETDAAVSQRDFDLSSILGLATGGISNSFGLSRNAITASAYDTRNPGQGALSGAASGAALGSEINVPYGTAIGAVAGGIGGYFAGGG